MKTYNFVILLAVIVILLVVIYFFLSPEGFTERIVTVNFLIGIFALCFYFGVKLLTNLGSGTEKGKKK